MAKEFKRYLVTSALPYANGPVHIGHLAGVYIPSDIYTRYLRLRGCDVLSVCGSDEHGVPITIKARKEGVTPQQIVDRYHSLIKRSFEGLGMSFDIYSRTSSKTHAETASAFFRKLYDEGKFIERTSMQYYDEEAQTFLADRYIVGTCPRCSNDRAYGDQCEKCGSTLSPDELIDPRSAVSGSVPVKRETKHWYLPLDRYEEFLRQWILEGHKEWKTNVYGQCKSWLDGGLQPRAVSRDLDWGIPVPVEGAEGKVLYVWFDAPIGYISATKDLTPDWEKYWKSEDTKMVHFIGKDNIVFHCIVFPSMLKAHGGYILPENVPANEFLNLEGDKISTSRNWAVWLHEYLEEFPGKEDVLRYVLCANAPETKDNDFTWKDFQARNNNELVAVLGNFVNRALVLTRKYCGGRVPACGELTGYDRQTIAEVAAVKGSLEGNIENYRFREALKDAMNIARIGNKYLADTEPWKVVKSDPARVETILNVALQITANTAIAIEPFMPFSAAKILRMLAVGKFGWERLGATDLIPAGHEIGEPKLLFEKIEDDVIQKQLDKLAATKAANQAAESMQNIESQKDTIQFDDFQKMDIRVSTILAAEKVAKTKKLLKLTVDTGLDRRVIVSGIAEHFAPEELVGRQVLVLVNLAPRELKGIVSNGMILMAEDASGKLRLLQPGEKTNNGATVG
ncbi:methionine--tRNA ligase [Alistipes dispar]|uniref:methionine--tRNA ligase n=1 Tax=Alistipes dispar TaxID=2585119 RepID=UPI00248C8589|nr:methionine--tRNA ligase [Alistipes dispar]